MPMAHRQTEQTYLTAEGYRKLKQELQVLEAVRLKEILAKLTSALEAENLLLGNTAYEQAFDEKARLEERIMELQIVLKSAHLAQGIGDGTIRLGSTVTLEIEGDRETYTLVSSFEVDAAESKISHVSPLGAALLGKKEGDQVAVEVPAGRLIYRVVEVA